MLARPAAGVEKCAGERACVRQADKGGLWAAYVPGRRRAGIGVVPVVGGSVAVMRHSVPVSQRDYGVTEGHVWSGIRCGATLSAARTPARWRSWRG